MTCLLTSIRVVAASAYMISIAKVVIKATSNLQTHGSSIMMILLKQNPLELEGKNYFDMIDGQMTSVYAGTAEILAEKGRNKKVALTVITYCLSKKNLSIVLGQTYIENVV